MANAKYTNLTALQALANGVSVHDDEELMTKVKAMITAEEKKAARAKNSKRTDSKQKRETMLKAAETIRAIAAAGNEPRSCAWVGEHVNGMLSSHKVSGVMNQARYKGLAIYGDKVDGKVTYQATEAGIKWAENPVPFSELPDVAAE